MIVHDNKQEPHWAPGAADYLASILTGEEVAIEWGGGGSTPWLLPKVKYLHTIESDPDWAERISILVGDAENFTLHVHPHEYDEYVTCSGESSNWGNVLWLIDGYNRIGCLELVMNVKDPGDIIVLDDALDYAEHLLPNDKIKRFTQPHPYAGKPVNQDKKKRWRNTVHDVHTDTKETWVWQV